MKKINEYERCIVNDIYNCMCTYMYTYVII